MIASWISTSYKTSPTECSMNLFSGAYTSITYVALLKMCWNFSILILPDISNAAKIISKCFWAMLLYLQPWPYSWLPIFCDSNCFIRTNCEKINITQIHFNSWFQRFPFMFTFLSFFIVCGQRDHQNRECGWKDIMGTGW